MEIFLMRLMRLMWDMWSHAASDIVHHSPPPTTLHDRALYLANLSLQDKPRSPNHARRRLNRRRHDTRGSQEPKPSHRDVSPRENQVRGTAVPHAKACQTRCFGVSCYYCCWRVGCTLSCVDIYYNKHLVGSIYSTKSSATITNTAGDHNELATCLANRCCTRMVSCCLRYRTARVEITAVTSIVSSKWTKRACSPSCDFSHLN